MEWPEEAVAVSSPRSARLLNWAGFTIEVLQHMTLSLREILCTARLHAALLLSGSVLKLFKEAIFCNLKEEYLCTYMSSP